MRLPELGELSEEGSVASLSPMQEVIAELFVLFLAGALKMPKKRPEQCPLFWGLGFRAHRCLR